MSTEKSIASNGLTLFSAPAAAVQQAEQQHLLIDSNSNTCFSFEMPLPAGIPETVKCSQIQVHYTISATLEYKKISASTTYKKKIEKQVLLVRLPENGILNGENHSGAVIDSQQQEYGNWCKYRITIDKKSVELGSKLPVKIEIVSCLAGLRIKQVFLQLIERRTIKKAEEETTNQLCHFIYPAKNSSDLHLPTRPLVGAWQGQCEYQIPCQNDKLTHSTRNYSDFGIHHVLLVSLIVSLPSGGDRSSQQRRSNQQQTIKTISFQTPIDLLDGQLTQFEQYRERLPSYDCPVSMEEVEKLNRHGLYYNHTLNPPPYYSIVAAI